MKVIVIGSGLIGLCTAHFLVQSGVKVDVLERGEGPARGASFANGGLLTSSMAEPWNAPGVFGELLRSIGRPDSPLLLRPAAIPSLLRWGISFLREARPNRHDRNTLSNIRLALYSRQVMTQLIDELNLRCSYDKRGALRIFREPSALQRALSRAKWLRLHNVPSKLLNSDEAVYLEPALQAIQSQLVGGIYYPNDAVGDARQFCEALTTSLLQAGTSVNYRLPVLAWKRHKRRIEGVITKDGLLFADAFVVAAGSESRGLSRGVGLDLPIRPVKGYSVTLPASDTSNIPRIPVIDDCLHAVVSPIGRLLRIAGTAEFAGFNLDVPQARVDNLHRLLREIYPKIFASMDASISQRWAGLRPVSADGVPIIGKTPLENLYVNTGHGHLGYTLAAGSGKVIADLITAHRPGLDVRDYALQRPRE